MVSFGYREDGHEEGAGARGRELRKGEAAELMG